MKIQKVLLILGFALISLQAFAADLNFTLTVPDGWNKKEKSTALAQYQKVAGSFIVTADAIPAEAKTPDAYIDFVKVKFNGIFQRITYETVVSGKKDGLETRELKYVVEMSGIKMKYDVLYIFKDDKAYTLTAANMDSFYDDEFIKDVKTFFSSFKFK